MHHERSLICCKTKAIANTEMYHSDVRIVMATPFNVHLRRTIVLKLIQQKHHETLPLSFWKIFLLGPSYTCKTNKRQTHGYKTHEKIKMYIYVQFLHKVLKRDTFLFSKIKIKILRYKKNRPIRHTFEKVRMYNVSFSI